MLNIPRDHKSISDAESFESTNAEIIDKIHNLEMGDTSLNISRQDGYSDFQQLIINEILWCVPNAICSCLGGKTRTFIILSSLWATLENISTCLRTRELSKQWIDDEAGPFCRKSYVDFLIGMSRNNLHRLSVESETSIGSHYVSLLIAKFMKVRLQLVRHLPTSQELTLLNY